MRLDSHPLLEDRNAEAVVIGGGMAGILIARKLMERGVSAVVVEAEEVGAGVTGSTTAKITAQHGLIYDKLIQTVGEKQALQYARANQQAVQAYRDMIKKEDIDCDLEEKDAYLYALKDTTQLEKEYRAAKRLGIEARMTERPGLPFQVKGSVQFPEQAQFHPLKFLRAAAQGVPVYDHTRVQGVEDSAVYTEWGKIHAKYIVIASHYPFVNAPGYYFLRMYQQRSYVLALEGAPEVLGMYLNASGNGCSFRQYGDLLLLGGGGHRTGQAEQGGYDVLRRQAKRICPQAKEVACWSAQDCMTLDGIPYIGSFSSSTPRVFVATGFGKWGMSTSMAAAEIIADLVTGRENENAPVFSPQRFHPMASAKNLFSGVGYTAKGQIKRFFYIPTSQADQLQKGEGAVVNLNGHKAGVYRDEEGRLHTVSVVCPHLGCQLEWNPNEKSWDCPCHGSRFDYRGNQLDTPAVNHCKRK